MKIVWNYILYFFYNSINWSPWLAFFVFYHDIRGAFKYGITTFAPVALKKLTIVNGDRSKASPYEAVNYYLLETLFTYFRQVSNADSLVDLGCGKGRVLVVAAHFGFTNITGIDFATELCEEASENIKKVHQNFQGVKWNVINDSAEQHNISHNDSVFFMFNPFTEEIVDKFLEKLERSCRLFPRTTWFLYASARHKKIFFNKGYEIIFQKHILNLKGIILRKD